jgi:hypothetical protein
VLFVISGIARLAALLRLGRIPHVALRPFTLATGALALRPSMGSMERPILPSAVTTSKKPHWMDRAAAETSPHREPAPRPNAPFSDQLPIRPHLFRVAPLGETDEVRA